jgi:hypothetical protein
MSLGEAIIFLHIPDDPTIVRCDLSIPRLDFQDDDENRFHRTSVAQVFAFFLNSLSTEAPSQVWHDTAAILDTWAVEIGTEDKFPWEGTTLTQRRIVRQGPSLCTLTC